jgi:ADP-heptose:LPS heptosyltransferase
MQFITQPKNILLLKPCCIGDVVNTTPLLMALRRAYPDASITWAIGTHSAPAIDGHPSLDNLMMTGTAANPAKSPMGIWSLSQQIRAGKFDLAIVPVRSPLISLAVWLAGVPVRAGLDSAGRGRLYNVRAPIVPQDSRHEATIYLDIARALHIDVADCWTNIPVSDEQFSTLPLPLKSESGIVVIHVGGGQNPGMRMIEKRPPIPLLANVAARAAAYLHARIAILGGPDDRARADELHETLQSMHPLSLVGILDFKQIAALGKSAAIAIGPDTGLLHLMAAAGAPTVMIFGPSDPHRYAPFVPPGQAVTSWRPYPLPKQGVASGPPQGWSWEQDGVTADEVWEAAKSLLNRE